MNGTKALRFRCQALVTDSQHLRELPSALGSQAAAAQASSGALAIAVADLKASPSLAQAVAIARCWPRSQPACRVRSTRSSSHGEAAETGRGWG